MALLLVAVISVSTLAFGAVYPWAFLPLFAAAAVIGIAGVIRGGVPRPLRAPAAALGAAWIVAALQLAPLPIPVIEAISPKTAEILRVYTLLFTTSPEEWLPLSLNPRSTSLAVLALGALSLYAIGLPRLLDGRTLRTLPPTLAIFAVPLALFGIYSLAHNDGLIYGFWRPQDGGGHNQAGPFINRNHFAGWMLMTACLLAGWCVGQIERELSRHRHHRWRAFEWWSSGEANGLLLTGAATFTAVIALFWVVSRSAIVGFSGGACLFAWMMLSRRRLAGRRRTAGVLVLGALLLTGIAWRGPDYLLARFQDESHLVGRWGAWRDGLAAARDFPIFGTGLNTYSDAMLFYQTSSSDVHFAQAHNDYVQLVTEGGILLFAAAAAAAGFLIRAIRRNIRAAQHEARGYWIRAGAAIGMCSIAIQEIFEFSLQIPANAFLFCTLAAIALTPVSSEGPHGPRDTIEPTMDSVGDPLP